MYRKLAPGPWFSSVGDNEFRQRYLALLDQLDPQKVIAELKELAGSNISCTAVLRASAAQSKMVSLSTRVSLVRGQGRIDGSGIWP